MEWLYTHLRNKLVAGALAATPLAVVAFVVWWLDQQTKPFIQPLGIYFPGLGILLAIAGIYLLGVIVTSIVGRVFLALADRGLRRIPGLSQLYQAWKDILVTPPGKAGIFDRVVLVRSLDGVGAQLGFTSSESPAAKTVCVFLPGVPNPIAGRLIMIDHSACVPLGVTVEDAFKFLLSSGNFMPAALQTVDLQHLGMTNRQHA